MKLLEAVVGDSALLPVVSKGPDGVSLEVSLYPARIHHYIIPTIILTSWRLFIGINRVELLGGVAADPQLTETAGGNTMARFGLITNRVTIDQYGKNVK